MEKPFKFEFKKDKGGNVEVAVKVEFKYFRDEREKALKKLGEEVEIKGFRKGQAPADALEGRLGPQANLHVIRKVSSGVVSELMAKEKEAVLSPLTVKHVSEYKAGEDMSFSFSFLSAPEIDVKKLKTIKVDAPKKEKVTNADVDKTLEEIWKEDSKATKAELTKGTPAEETTLLGPDGKPIKSVKAKKDGEDKEDKFDSSKLSNEWAKKIDPSVETVDELKKKLTGALQGRKDQYAGALYEHNLFDLIAKTYDLKAPEDLVSAELINREEEFYQMARMSGVSPAEYVKSQNVSIEQLRENWKRQTEAGIQQMMIVTGVAKAADLEVTNSEVDKAKKEGEKPEAVKLQLLKQKVMEYLGNQKQA